MINDEYKWMKLAYDEAKKCVGESERPHPKVGAVVTTSNGQLLASAHRGQQHPGDHAEFTALEKVLPHKNLTGSIVYTTLEPCTVRSHDKVPCLNRLIERKVKRVVIGMLDPNKDICGRGELGLLAAGIEVGRFTPKLTKRILELNRDFIRSQQKLGLHITDPLDGADFRGTQCTIRGTYVNAPDGDVFAVTNIDANWWPQLNGVRVDEAKREWEVMVNFGIAVPHKVYIVRANALGKQLIDFYRTMVSEREEAIKRVSKRFEVSMEDARQAVATNFWSMQQDNLPKGLEREDCITINVLGLGSKKSVRSAKSR